VDLLNSLNKKTKGWDAITMGPAVVMRLQAALLRDVRGKFLDDPAVSAIEDLRHTLAEATQDTLGQAGRRTAAATSSCARSSPANRFASLKTTLRHERMHRQQIALSGGAFTSHVDWDALLNHPLTLAAFRRQCFQAALHRGAELPGARLDLGGGHLRQVAALRTRCSPPSSCTPYSATPCAAGQSARAAYAAGAPRRGGWHTRHYSRWPPSHRSYRTEAGSRQAHAECRRRSTFGSALVAFCRVRRDTRRRRERKSTFAVAALVTVIWEW
jgi:hypothetical protein